MAESRVQNRLKQWRRYWEANFDKPWVRYLAWLDAIVIDHGLLRPLWNRPERFASNAWRGNQPSARQVRRLANKGIRTIVSLRGLGNIGASLFEIEAAEQANVTLISFRMSSRGAPRPARVDELIQLMSRIDTPVLFHCKSGADRSGFAAGVYLLVTGQGTVQDAKAQLSWRYLHFKGAKTGLLHEFFCEYERYCRQTPMAFQQWVNEVYDPVQLERQFKPAGFTSWVVDKVLRRE
ncbi:fused DSP-PTPase phosphatase/NAD kinase-like protein [Saccharospirillum impatiens]|uniref:fused DSP-PTPase phosphatase/NAD kinase-like protein n=1 Tax=Saccharospirillum impatiens TaxID=169438 RepID=UPI00041BFF75|nr:tyrosine-protein phosphatase [Saccharospirillum impatiens]